MKAGGVEGADGGQGVAGDALVGDDEGAVAVATLAGERPQAGEVARGDGEVVAALAQLDCAR